ncbi:O-antigen ligase family protein [Bradyrhizobium paxllaeri]|uniref:O-antigen ligase family protein n=1 Tax=Bradyrhizobium paxllaeri TaxID=190148 RepID=UPI0009FFB976
MVRAICERVQYIAIEYRDYRESSQPTSTGQRLEYWRVSIRAIAEAPLFGHGTGATKLLFDREAEGKSGAWADSIRNPHNQTLSVAVQWGVLGCTILYAMWYFHLNLFREASLAGWVGSIVVCQNFFSSLLIPTCSIFTRVGCTCWVWGARAVFANQPASSGRAQRGVM